MCGIAGILSADPGKTDAGLLKKMTDAIAHRGPDGEGAWISGSCLAALGHRRLSILDPGPAAAQPMHLNGRYTIVYNGEIYNYIELKQQLAGLGYAFFTQSDTEVILTAFDRWGTGCLQHFDGMFAFAIWDEIGKELFLARDRMGEKPLYFCRTDERFLFASEMKALWAAGMTRTVNRKMLFNFLTIGYAQNPGDAGETFYEGIFNLPPRSFLVYNPITGSSRTEYYWDTSADDTREIGEQEAIERFRELFYLSVNRRLRSDVPYGASLSGGLDSSSIIAAITGQTGSDKLLPVFSAVFPGFEKDESAFIRTASDHFPVSNHFVTPDSHGFAREFEELARHQEEPFLSASVYAQFTVCAKSSEQGIKVMLDGQGADEIMAGYHKYYHSYWQELYASDKSSFGRELRAARSLGVSDEWSWKNKLAAMFPACADRWKSGNTAFLQKRHRDLAAGFARDYGLSYYQAPHFDKLSGVLYYNSFINGLGELLRYADRNSMAHGIEIRLPFLDHQLIEFVFSLPARFKIRNGWTKWLLRLAMAPALPDAITWRTDKTGYEPPQRRWMQDPVLSDYLHEAKKTLIRESVLHPSIADKKNQPLDANAAENYDWRYLVAASCLYH